MGEKLKKIAMYWLISFMEFFLLKPLLVRILNMFTGMWNDSLMHREGLKSYTSYILKSRFALEKTNIFLYIPYSAYTNKYISITLFIFRPGNNSVLLG